MIPAENFYVVVWRFQTQAFSDLLRLHPVLDAVAIRGLDPLEEVRHLRRQIPKPQTFVLILYTNVGTLIIRIRCCGPLYYKYNKEPPK